MSFTDQKPFVATEQHVKARWGSGFSCKLCGHTFKAGDTVRFVYANGTPNQQTGNFLVCKDCDGEDVLTRAKDNYLLATRLAKQWNIYGPDWQRDMQRYD